MNVKKMYRKKINNGFNCGLVEFRITEFRKGSVVRWGCRNKLALCKDCIALDIMKKKNEAKRKKVNKIKEVLIGFSKINSPSEPLKITDLTVE